VIYIYLVSALICAVAAGTQVAMRNDGWVAFLLLGVAVCCQGVVAQHRRG
jgi:hypothetical protein